MLISSVAAELFTSYGVGSNSNFRISIFNLLMTCWYWVRRVGVILEFWRQIWSYLKSYLVWKWIFTRVC